MTLTTYFFIEWFDMTKVKRKNASAAGALAYMKGNYKTKVISPQLLGRFRRYRYQINFNGL